MIPISRTTRNPDGTINIQLIVNNDLLFYKSSPEVEKMLTLIRERLVVRPFPISPP